MIDMITNLRAVKAAEEAAAALDAVTECLGLPNGASFEVQAASCCAAASPSQPLCPCCRVAVPECHYSADAIHGACDTCTMRLHRMIEAGARVIPRPGDWIVDARDVDWDSASDDLLGCARALARVVWVVTEDYCDRGSVSVDWSDGSEDADVISVAKALGIPCGADATPQKGER